MSLECNQDCYYYKIYGRILNKYIHMISRSRDITQLYQAC